MYRHRQTWDFTGLTPAQRAVLQPALEACDYPFSRIRRNTGRRVPVTASDLSRFAQALAEHHREGHVHVHDEDGNEGHLLGEPATSASRSAALGLYWLPTSKYPAGRVELDSSIFGQPDLAREVLLAEGAHAVDYGAMDEQDRSEITAAYIAEHRDPDGTDDWFDERGEDDYWSWIGESFMSGFTRAFAPSLPRPLEARQPWKHPSSDAIAARIREVLK